MQGVDYLAVDQAEVTDVQRHRDLAKPVEKPVEEPGADYLEAGLTEPAHPLAVDHLMAFPPPCYHLSDQLRRILQIGVDDDHGVAGGMLQTGGYRDLMSEIAG